MIELSFWDRIKTIFLPDFVWKQIVQDHNDLVVLRRRFNKIYPEPVKEEIQKEAAK